MSWAAVVILGVLLAMGAAFVAQRLDLLRMGGPGDDVA
jgi:hypothetical protein